MAPRRQRPTNGLYDHENIDAGQLEQRISQMIDERLDSVVERLTERMGELLSHRPLNRTPTNDNIGGHGQDEAVVNGQEDNDYFEEAPQQRYVYQIHRNHNQRECQQWEAGMRIEIPEFHGSLQPEEFLDWLATVEEVLEFKDVPEDKRVQLVATRFRSRATTWWQQLKLTRNRSGKAKINSWDKLKKHPRTTFLPYNYQRLQSLKQGSKSVDDYTTEFYQLVARNELQETEEQLVARYIGGLKMSIQDTVNMFDPVTVSAAHQRALVVEKQQLRRLSVGNMQAYGSMEGNKINNVPSTEPIGSSSASRMVRPNLNGVRCFNCGETGHRRTECHKMGK